MSLGSDSLRACADERRTQWIHCTPALLLPRQRFRGRDVFVCVWQVQLWRNVRMVGSFLYYSGACACSDLTIPKPHKYLTSTAGSTGGIFVFQIGSTHLTRTHALRPQNCELCGVPTPAVTRNERTILNERRANGKVPGPLLCSIVWLVAAGEGFRFDREGLRRRVFLFFYHWETLLKPTHSSSVRNAPSWWYGTVCSECNTVYAS